MSRTPLFPRGGNWPAWAQALTQRIERDFAFLRPKTGTVSLSATVSNIVTDINMTTTARVFLTPVTSQAATTVLAGMWVSSKTQGQFVITTSGSATPSSVFDYLIAPPPEV